MYARTWLNSQLIQLLYGNELMETTEGNENKYYKPAIISIVIEPYNKNTMNKEKASQMYTWLNMPT